jgi:hypothetical protein
MNNLIKNGNIFEIKMEERKISQKLFKQKLLSLFETLYLQIQNPSR